jgi:hypothetical protein
MSSPRQYFAFVTVARKNALATSGAPKVETATSAVETRQRDEDVRGAATGGDAGGRRPAAKGRGDHRRQGDKLAGKATGTRLAFVVAGRGRRVPSAGTGRPAASNPLHFGARAAELVGRGDRLLGGRRRPRQMEYPFGRCTCTMYLSVAVSMSYHNYPKGYVCEDARSS